MRARRRPRPLASTSVPSPAATPSSSASAANIAVWVPPACVAEAISDDAAVARNSHAGGIQEDRQRAARERRQLAATPATDAQPSIRATLRAIRAVLRAVRIMLPVYLAPCCGSSASREKRSPPGGLPRRTTFEHVRRAAGHPHRAARGSRQAALLRSPIGSRRSPGRR